jgi:chromosomal replication initiation ATPase DnaA
VHAVAAELGLFDQVEAVWAEVIRDVRPYNKNLQAVLNSIHPVDVEANTLLLQAPSPFHKGQVENPKNRRIIEDVLTRHVGQPLTIRCIEQQPQAREADLREQMREARKDPRVRAAINIFSPVDVSIEAAAEPE